MFTWSPPHDHEPGEEHSHEPAMTGSLYIYVDDVMALHADVKNRVDVMHGPSDEPHGNREFVVRDPNGYVLIFGQVL